MKIYISGKISGLPKDEVTAKFTAAERTIRVKGHIPVNPLNNGLPWDTPYTDHLKADIKQLMDCDAVYLLNDAYISAGAKTEKELAMTLGMGIIYEENGDWLMHRYADDYGNLRHATKQL